MIIGVIGGVGSGKSTVLDYLEKQYLAEIIKTDDVAKEIMEPGHTAFEQIKETFPMAFVDNRIDNDILAKIVFDDKNQLIKLNNITHPQTIDEVTRRIQNAKSEIVVVESAILLGTGIEKMCDKIWFVYCDKNKRIERLMNSRNYSREKSESIIANQPTDVEYRNGADEVIDNSYTVHDTNEQIDRILSTLPCGF